MALIYEKKGRIAYITLNRPEAQNAFDPETVVEIIDAWKNYRDDDHLRCAIITGAGDDVFSSGADLKRLIPLITGVRQPETEADKIIQKDPYLPQKAFLRTMKIDKPIIAAINGHAFGNGAILSCACDFRFMKSGRGYFCFPEVDLGIPFLPGMIAFVRKAVPEYKFNEMKLTGKRVGADELAAHHIIEKACPDADAVFAESLAFARTFHKKRGIFGEHKKRMHRHIIEVIDTEDPNYIEPLNLMVAD